MKYDKNLITKKKFWIQVKKNSNENKKYIYVTLYFWKWL